MSSYVKNGAPAPELEVFNPQPTPVQRGMQQVHADKVQTYQTAYQDSLASTRAAAIGRDINAAGRDRYQRAHDNHVRTAKILQEITGRHAPVLKYLHAPAAVSEFEPEPTNAPSTPSECYRETGGKGPSGRGLPTPGIPGSATEDWPAFEAAKKGAK